MQIKAPTTYPFIVDVQDALLDGLNSRVVIPLTPSSNLEKPYPKNLCPEKPEKTKPFHVRDLVLRHVGHALTPGIL